MIIKLEDYSSQTQVINAKHIVSLDYENKSGKRTSSDGYYLHEWDETKFVITITMVNGSKYIKSFQEENTAKIFYNTVLAEMGEQEYRMSLIKED